MEKMIHLVASNTLKGSGDTYLPNSWNYVDHIPTLLKSFLTYNNPRLVKIDLINPTKDQINKILDCYPADFIEVNRHFIENEKEIIVSSMRLKVAAFQNLKLYKWVMHLDCDTLIRGEINNLIDSIEQATNPCLFILVREHHDINMRWNSGVMITNTLNKPHMDKWLEYFDNKVKSDKQFEFMTDQITLYSSYLDSKPKPQIFSLTTKYNDMECKPDGVIWHIKGKANILPQWKKECQKHAFIL